MENAKSMKVILICYSLNTLSNFELVLNLENIIIKSLKLKYYYNILIKSKSKKHI
jgi:hypothetical protein